MDFLQFSVPFIFSKTISRLPFHNIQQIIGKTLFPLHLQIKLYKRCGFDESLRLKKWISFPCCLDDVFSLTVHFRCATSQRLGDDQTQDYVLLHQAQNLTTA